MPAVSGSSYLTVARYHVLALSGNATTGIDDGTIQAIADAKSAWADSVALAARYALPLQSWGPELELCIANLTSYQVMMRRGFNPQNPTDKAIADAKAEADQWLNDVAGRIVQPNIVDAGGAVPLPDDLEAPTRGWKEWGTRGIYGRPTEESDA